MQRESPPLPHQPPMVFVVDDDPAIRKLVAALAQSVQLHVEAFENASQFSERIGPDAAGCLLLDIRMPNLSGLELQKDLQVRGYHLPIIVITGYSDVSVAVQALKAGAFDYIEKPFQNQAMLDVIQAALRHDLENRRWQRRQKQVLARMAELTPGERDVLDRMVAGKGYKAIANELNLSYKTIEARRGKIMKKMKVEGLPELMHEIVVIGKVGGENLQ